MSSTNFDLKAFMIKEGLTRISRDRQRLQKNTGKVRRLNEDWTEEDDQDEIAPGFKIPKRWKDYNDNFTLPAGDMSKIAGTGGHYPKSMIGKESEKAAWDAIKQWNVAEFFDFHGMVDEELKDWSRENVPDFDEKDWHCEFSKGTDKATGRYVGFTSDDFMTIDEPAEKARWVKLPQRSTEHEWTTSDSENTAINDYLMVLQDTADIIVETGGYNWALVWYLKKV